MQDIKTNIDDIMEKMNLLEIMYHNISYSDFEMCWKVYGRPLEL